MISQHTQTNPSQLKGKDFITLSDWQPDAIVDLLDQAQALKQQQKNGGTHPYLQGKMLGMIFEKSSTRTRVSFEVGMKQLGGDAIFLSSNDIQLGRGESIEDTAKVLSRYIDGIMVRTYAHESVETLAKHADVPIINGLTDEHHPTQVLADLLTIYEQKGSLAGLKMAFIGDGHNNMCHSLLEGAASVGMHISVASPKGFGPQDDILNNARNIGQATGSQIAITESPQAAVEQADVVVTDVFASMGQEAEQAERLKTFANYQVNEALCQHANDDYMFLHCLPAHRGEEVTTEIIDGAHSFVFDEAENRLHAQKAILKNVM
ncbi:ornithine carbamoyltransferase [Tuberibacillus sp. Marseille-P3662]|uniref:ornithine carbamoyltransferase n=1 Tax=Tuberibacillus sp. Marseille-P3662 TaxID=1965358 RepID=UPI000A1CA215|nr:ornithine carbamoyltransferase [Tuberibacillus sp. Marseille-P3662]